MRKILAAVTIAVLALTLTACDDESSVSKGDPMCWLSEDPFFCLAVTGQK